MKPNILNPIYHANAMDKWSVTRYHANLIAGFTLKHLEMDKLLQHQTEPAMKQFCDFFTETQLFYETQQIKAIKALCTKYKNASPETMTQELIEHFTQQNEEYVTNTTTKWALFSTKLQKICRSITGNGIAPYLYSIIHPSDPLRKTLHQRNNLQPTEAFEKQCELIVAELQKREKELRQPRVTFIVNVLSENEFRICRLFGHDVIVFEGAKSSLLRSELLLIFSNGFGHHLDDKDVIPGPSQRLIQNIVFGSSRLNQHQGSLPLQWISEHKLRETTILKDEFLHEAMKCAANKELNTSFKFRSMFLSTGKVKLEKPVVEINDTGHSQKRTRAEFLRSVEHVDYSEPGDNQNHNHNRNRRGSYHKSKRQKLNAGLSQQLDTHSSDEKNENAEKSFDEGDIFKTADSMYPGPRTVHNENDS